MKQGPREVYTRQVKEQADGVVKDVIICIDGNASQATIEYKKENGETGVVTAVTDSSRRDFEKGEEVTLIPG
ncbi:MAG: hypothetical protein M3Q34_02205 [bacterium]|nr:hypothetical protein [bacterium]